MYSDVSYYGSQMLTMPFSSDALVGMVGGLVLFWIIGMSVTMLAMAAVYVARAQMFVKAGEAAWKAIIPVLDVYTLFKISWGKKPFVIFLASMVMCAAGALLFMMGAASTSGQMIIGVLLMIIGVLVMGIISIILQFKIAWAFDKGIGYALGLIFFTGIFLLVLGFGSAEYVLEEYDDEDEEYDEDDEEYDEDDILI